MVYLGLVLTRVSISIAFLLIAVLTHIILKTFYNISIVKEGWSWVKFREGLYKTFVVLLGTYLLSITLAFFPIFLTMLGVPISNDVIEYLNVTTILLMMLKPTIAYTKRNIENLEKIILGLLPDKPRNINKETEEIQEVKEEVLEQTKASIIKLNG